MRLLERLRLWAHRRTCVLCQLGQAYDPKPWNPGRHIATRPDGTAYLVILNGRGTPEVTRL